MKISISSHFKLRLKERLIPQSYPKLILSSPDESYYDTITKHYISLKKLEYNKKVRPMVIAYDIIGSVIQVITIYPTSNQEVKKCVQAKRWIKNEKE